jgi:hypothetical protein
MARVTYYVEGDRSSRVSRSMLTPKKMYSLAHWYRAARTALPKIPDPTDHEGWYISHSLATIDTIVFRLESIWGGPASRVIIDRKADNIGF